MLTAVGILAIAAFITAIFSIHGKCPLWVSVVLLSIAILLQVVPVK